MGLCKLLREFWSCAHHTAQWETLESIEFIGTRLSGCHAYLADVSPLILIYSELLFPVWNRCAFRTSNSGLILIILAQQVCSSILVTWFSTANSSQHVSQRRGGCQAQHRQGLLGHCGWPGAWRHQLPESPVFGNQYSVVVSSLFISFPLLSFHLLCPFVLLRCFLFFPCWTIWAKRVKHCSEM